LVPLDVIWLKMLKEYPKAESIEIHPPETDSAAIAANANDNKSTYHTADYRYFDQYTLQEIEVNHLWGRIKNDKIADRIFKMNYDIHTGGIFGLAGKIFAFLISLLIASLPVTGTLIWWGRKKKNRRQCQ
jgi:uncharacterized iron-regulated membrane protein